MQLNYDVGARDLALAVYEKAIERGALVSTNVGDDEFVRAFYQNADEDQLTAPVPEYKLEKLRATDKYLSLRAPQNATELADVPPEKRQLAQQAPGSEEMQEERLANTRWSLTQYPTKALAQNAGMSTEEYWNFVINACVRDWEEEREKYMGLKEIVDAGSEVRLLAENTDLRFSIEGYDGVDRVGVLSDGTSNIPGGEVFTTPVKESFEGHVYFDLPAMVSGQEVSGIRLEFGEDGRIVDYSAEKGEELLEEKLDTDEGSRFIGEFGIGTNFGIDQPSRDILFDEKIGGTIHLAVGRAYKDCMEPNVDYDDIDNPGLGEEAFRQAVDQAVEALQDDSYTEAVNEVSNGERQVMAATRERFEELEENLEEQQNSSLTHWDMITDLREEGKLLIDGEVIMEEGEFVGVDGL